MRYLLQRLLPVMTIGILFLSNVCGAQSSNQAPKKHSWTIGVGLPSGSGVSDCYGSAWLNLQGNLRLREDKKCEHSLTLGITGGTKSRDFMANSYVHPESKADYTASIVSVGYNYKVKMPSRFYYGAGIGLSYIRTSAEYDAGKGFIWTHNDERYIEVSKSGTSVAPVLRVGYEIKEKLSIDLNYTIFNTTLAGNTAGLRGLPSVPDTNLNGLLKLNANMSF